jgi:hypothetical protein
MVRIRYQDIQETYNYIKSTTKAKASGVLILTANEVDAMASTRMLSYLLKIDNIYYSIQMVSNVEQILEAYEKCKTSEDKIIIMMNCGATLNIPKLFDLQRGGTNIRCFIMDNHRPFHLANLYSPYAVVVFDDNVFALNEDLLPEDGSDVSCNESENDDDEDDNGNGSVMGDDDGNEDDVSDDDVDALEEEDEEEGDGEAEWDGEGDNDEDNDEGGVDVEGEANEDEEAVEADAEEVDQQGGDDGDDNQDAHEMVTGLETGGGGAVDDTEVEDYDVQQAGAEVEADHLEQEDSEGLRPVKRTRLDNDDNDDDNDDDDEGGQVIRSRRAPDPRAVRKDKLRSYYRSGESFTGCPTAFRLLDIVRSQANRQEIIVELIWNAALGVTDVYLRNLMNEADYSAYVNVLKSDLFDTTTLDRGMYYVC